MNKYSITIEIEDGKVKELIERIDSAQRVIYECYCELESLGVLVIKEKSTSGN